jgi:hypothetical protein
MFRPEHGHQQEGFQQRNSVLRRNGFFDFFHCPKNKITTFKTTTFRRLVLLPSSGKRRGKFPKHRNFNCSYFVLRTVETVEKHITSQHSTRSPKPFGMYLKEHRPNNGRFCYRCAHVSQNTVRPTKCAKN